MKVILNPQFESLTGQLIKNLPYYIRRRKDGFYVSRNPNKKIRHGDLLIYMIEMAKLARMRYIITDIEVPKGEYLVAIYEVVADTIDERSLPDTLHADDVINITKLYYT